MKLRTRLLCAALFVTSATPAMAQDKYETYVGQYVASTLIAGPCDGFTTYDVQGAGNIAKSKYGLRKQKVLRLLYYGKTDQLMQLGRDTLSQRSVNPDSQNQLCRFGRKVANTDDGIGRFLRTK